MRPSVFKMENRYQNDPDFGVLSMHGDYGEHNVVYLLPRYVTYLGR